jgi:transposase-like protein
MAHPPELKAALRRAYVHDRLSLEAAADRLEIGVATARRWKAAAENEGDDWERARAAISISSAGASNIAQMLISDYLPLHQAVIEGLKDSEAPALEKAEALSRLADAATKTMAALAKATPALNKQAVAGEVLDLLTRFIGDRSPDLLPAFIDALSPFTVFLAKELGR